MTVLIERDGGVLVATLNRPDKKNALTGAMYRALRGALVTASAEAEIGAVLVTGAGGAFCAGNDISDFLTENRAQSEGARTGAGGEFIRTLARFDKPLLAAVEGPAVGVGTTMCLHCDLVYAAPSARFAMPFVNLGLVPEAGSSMLVPNRFGRAVAAELLLLGEAIDAARAREIGLVNAIVAPDALKAHALAKARALAAKPRAALLATRKLMRGDTEALYAHMEEELKAFALALKSPEARAAFEAFAGRAKG
ncbi:MAG: enoyl-CoA hydratase/isomerase family protein [Pseudomonadota bacterium]|nr:enoyl-CoA hydratase/isomerase family protein [Pseudomonadota bacterium]